MSRVTTVPLTPGTPEHHESSRDQALQALNAIRKRDLPALRAIFREWKAFGFDLTAELAPHHPATFVRGLLALPLNGPWPSRAPRRRCGEEAPTISTRLGASVRALEEARLLPGEMRHVLNFITYELRGRLTDSESDAARREALAVCAAMIDQAERCLYDTYAVEEDEDGSDDDEFVETGTPR